MYPLWRLNMEHCRPIPLRLLPYIPRCLMSKRPKSNCRYILKLVLLWNLQRWMSSNSSHIRRKPETIAYQPLLFLRNRPNMFSLPPLGLLKLQSANLPAFRAAQHLLDNLQTECFRLSVEYICLIQS